MESRKQEVRSEKWASRNGNEEAGVAFPVSSSLRLALMSRPTLLYVYDALCGWCYGFGPVMQRVAETYADTFDFEVLSGGMVRGDRIGPIGEVAGYISHAYKQVEERSGVTFGDAFLNGTMAEGTALFTSIPPSRALTAFKATQPADADGTEQVAFAHALQRAVYYDGLPPAEPSTYARIATDFGLDGNAFAAQLDDRLRARVSSSDVVQETFYEAHRDFPAFRGATPEEFLGWLRRILLNNLLRAVEQHVTAAKRDVRREVSIARAIGDQSAAAGMAALLPHVFGHRVEIGAGGSDPATVVQEALRPVLERLERAALAG